MANAIVDDDIRQRFEGMFPGTEITLVHAIDAMTARFDHLPDQRPTTCGAYGLSYLLEPLGYANHDGHDLTDEDYLAHMAAVIIEDHEVEPSRAIWNRIRRDELTEADALRDHRMSWYRYPVRHSDDPDVVGTSPMGIARAVDLATSGELVSLPVPSRRADREIQFTPERFDAFLELLAANTAAWRWHAIFNYQLVEVLKPDDPAYTIDNLHRADPTDVIPLDDWDAGHFIGIAGLWRRAGAWWLLLLDTFKGRGFGGYQPQPGELMRKGLIREDGRGGGVLLLLPRPAFAIAKAAIENLSLDLGMWDNGSTAPEDWEWRPAA
jgi:hypothetical protein